jgi:FkbM family methyltransferase
MDITTIRCSKGQAKVRLDVPHGQQKKHWSRGIFYEHQLLEYIAKTFKGGIFIDAGSALGNHTLFFALFCGCSVVSIEPITESLDLQKSILELNNVTKKVIFFNAALGSQNGYCDMVRFGPGVGHWRCGEGNNTRVLTLDHICEMMLIENCTLDKITLLKLDIEWSEISALVGAQKLLAIQQPAIVAEINEQSELEVIKSILSPFGYKLVRKFPSVNYLFRAE